MLDHIICHAARLRTRTRGRLSCLMVLRVPWGGGIRAPEHHSEANESLFTNVPGLRVVLPSSQDRAYGLLLVATREPRSEMGRVRKEGGSKCRSRWVP